MSRAFVKETDDREPRCPVCTGRGVPVTRVTIAALAGEPAAARLGAETFCCDVPSCEIAWFDGVGARVRVDELRAPPWPKDPSAPVCACFGVGADQIEAWGARADTAAVKALLERVKGTSARCATKAFDGSSCEPHVRKIFLRARGLG